MSFLPLILFKIIFIISLWVNALLAQGKELQTPFCPIGFSSLLKNDKKSSLCYRRKSPETFSDKYKDCAGNLFTSELLPELNFSKTDGAVWTEFKSMYPGGIFYDSSFARQKLDLPIRPSWVKQKELCLIYDPVNKYRAQKCNRKYSSYCVIKSYQESLEGCPGLKNSFRFQSPDSTCLTDLTGDGGSALNATWNQAQDLCRKNGASLINRGWKYANHPVFHRSSTKNSYPLGIILSDNLSSLRYDTIEDGSKIPQNFLKDFCDNTRNPEKLLGRLKNDICSFVSKSYIFNKIICELPLGIRTVSLKVAIDVDHKITLSTNDALNHDDIDCLTDSVNIHPTTVTKGPLKNTNLFTLSPEDDGYYWCICKNTINFNPAQSNKLLFLRDKKSLVNIYSIKFQLNSKLKLLLEDWERVREDTIKKIKEYIYYRTKYIKVFGDRNSNLTEDILKKFKNSNPDLKRNDKSILNTKLKRIYLDRQTVLVHVELNSDMKPVTPGSWDGIKVLHMKAVYYCKGFDSIPDKPLGQSELKKCQNYTCVGDFNEGVEWTITTQDTCINSDNTSIDSTTVVHHHPLALFPLFGVDARKEKLEQVIRDLDRLVRNSSPVMMEDIKEVFDQVDEILEVRDNLEIPSQLLQLLDSLGSNLNLNGSRNATTVRNNIALVLADATPSHPVRGMKIASRDSDIFTDEAFKIFSGNLNDTDLDSDLNEVVVHLPLSLSETSRRVLFVVFRNDRAFRTKENVYSINSKIISIKIENITKFENDEVVDIHFTPIVRNIDRNESRACAYWQFTNDTGYWSQEGCSLIFAARSNKLSTCRCIHLTHFAEVLFRREVFSQQNEDTLELVTIIGCCLSIFGLSTVGLTAVLFRSWRRDFTNKIWLQLCIAIFLLVLTFLIVIFSKFKEYSIFCMLLGVVLHYSVLSSFCWMLVAAVLSYRRLVLVFTTDASHKLLRASAFAYGTPCAVIGILLLTAPQSYNGRFDEESPTASFCYPSGLALWISVYAPIAIIIVVNWILFAFIVRSVFLSRSIQRHGDSNEALRAASVSCLLVFLFGLPWISGLFAFNVIAAYIFTLTATYQGLILFLFFVLGNKKTRDLWLNKLKNKQIVTMSMSSRFGCKEGT